MILNFPHLLYASMILTMISLLIFHLYLQSRLTFFYGRENDDAIVHLTKLAELGDLFTTDEKIRNFYMAKLFPFSLKGDAKSWYNALPSGSIESPRNLVQFLLINIFLLICNMLLCKESITLNSCRMSTSLKLGGGIVT